MSIQFSYYRNIHASHMILTPALEGEPWEKEMLWRNRPRELILPEYNSRNGQTQLWYDITGKQAVDMLAELSGVWCDGGGTGWLVEISGYIAAAPGKYFF